MRLCEDLSTILIPLPYNVEKGTHNLLVIVMDEEDYEHLYHAKFPTPTKPTIYKEKTPNNATNMD